MENEILLKSLGYQLTKVDKITGATHWAKLVNKAVVRIKIDGKKFRSLINNVEDKTQNDVSQLEYYLNDLNTKI